MNLYCGNLSYDMEENDLRDAFEAHGEVESARIVRDRDTDRPRGFGFVEMVNRTDAEKAIQALNGSEVMGRELVVNEARPRRGR